MIIKISIGILLLACCIFYLKTIEAFVKFCTTALNEDFKHQEIEKYMKLKLMCRDINIKYSNHYILNATIDKINRFIYNSDYFDYETVAAYIETTNATTLKYVMVVYKLIQIVIYSVLLYLMMNFLMFIINKTIIIILLSLMIEGL